MKITVSKHTTIDWEAIKNEFSAQAIKAIDSVIAEAKEYNLAELPEGKSIAFASKLGKITIRRSKD